MDNTKKKRAENWSSEEKEILRQIRAQSARIIEDKSNKTSANFQKNKEWKNITIKFNEILGKSRTDTEMKLAWKRIKLSAKANVSNHRREQFQTGGGEKPPSPSPEDLAIMDIAPHDFIVEVNDFVSDAVIPNAASAIVSTQSDMDSTAPEPSIPSPSIGPIAGPSIEFTDLTVEEHLEPVTIEEQVVSSNKPSDKHRPARKEISNRTEEMRQSIASSNIDFKKQQIKIMQIEHSNNIKYKQRQQEIMEIEHSNNNEIAQLKIKK